MTDEHAIPKFTLPKDAEYIGRGGFGLVYRISPRRVLKIFISDHNQYELAKDEIENVPKYLNGLPVLKMVRIAAKDHPYNGHIAIIKRYLPRPAELKDISELRKHLKETGEDDYLDSWDCSFGNYRKDSRGRLFRVDTASKACLDMD